MQGPREALRRPPFELSDEQVEALASLLTEAVAIERTEREHPLPRWTATQRESVRAELRALREGIESHRTGDLAGVRLAGRLDALDPEARWLLGRDLGPADFDRWQRGLRRRALGLLRRRDESPGPLLERLATAEAWLASLPRLPTRERDWPAFAAGRHLWRGWRRVTRRGIRTFHSSGVAGRERATRRGPFEAFLALFAALTRPDSPPSARALADLVTRPDLDCREAAALRTAGLLSTE
jgi:hypothetical protein